MATRGTPRTPGTPGPRRSCEPGHVKCTRKSRFEIRPKKEIGISIKGAILYSTRKGNWNFCEERELGNCPKNVSGTRNLAQAHKIKLRNSPKFDFCSDRGPGQVSGMPCFGEWKTAEKKTLRPKEGNKHTGYRAHVFPCRSARVRVHVHISRPLITRTAPNITNQPTLYLCHYALPHHPKIEHAIAPPTTHISRPLNPKTKFSPLAQRRQVLLKRTFVEVMRPMLWGYGGWGASPINLGTE